MPINPPNPALASLANGQGRVLDINPLKYLEKIEVFDGRKEHLTTFCTNVDDILPTLLSYNEQAQRMCINIIKSKLVGKARRAMEIHPHLSNWTDIKGMLETNFGGFQTADQLYEELRAAQYRGNTLDFYNFILQKLAMLNQKSRQEGNIADVGRNIQTALKIFTTRLPVHMRTVLCALKPKTMEEAIHELSQSGFLNEEKEKNSRQQNNHHHKREGRNNWQPKSNYQRQQDNNWRPRLYAPQPNQRRNFNPNWQQGPSFQPYNLQPQVEPMDTSTQQTRRQYHNRQAATKPECNCKCVNCNNNNKINHVTLNKQKETYEPGNFPALASPPDDTDNPDFPIFYSKE